MKTASAPLRALIESGVYFRADLYTITLIDGTIIRTTSADITLSWGGNTFLSDKPKLIRETLRQALGLEVDSLELILIAEPDDLISGLTYSHAFKSGVFDGARVLLEKAYLASWTTGIVGVLHGFYGLVSDGDAGRTGISLEVKSALELLNTEMPRNLFQSPCLHTVYDLGCTLNKASFTTSGTVTSSIAATLTKLSSNVPAISTDGYFDLGVLFFTSGANNGLRRTVKKYTAVNDVFEFNLPLKAVPSVGDTFSVYPGCDRLQSTCSGKFANISHFKGYPYIPTPETVY